MNNTEDLLTLIERFLQPAYSRQDAVDALGDERKGKRPLRVDLQPRDAGMDSVQLGLVKHPDEPFLTSITIDFVQPVELSFAGLTAHHGEPEERPRLHPDEPIPFHFGIGGYPLRGDLIVEVVGEQEQEQMRAVSGLRLIRHPGTSPVPQA